MSDRDIVSLFDSDSQSEFSGFDEVEPFSRKEKMKSVVVKKTPDTASAGTKSVSTKSSAKKPSTRGAGSKTKGKKPVSETQSSVCNKQDKLPVQCNSNETVNRVNFDINKLTQEDISQLRQALGIMDYDAGVNSYEFDSYTDTYEAQPIFDVNQMPNIHVQIDSENISDHECDLDYNNNVSSKSVTKGFANALFEAPQEAQPDGSDSFSDDWALPKLKCPEKGEAIPQSLASLINTACTSQCDTDTIVTKYKVPENCDSLGAPLVNSEIWKILDKRARTMDRGIADIQNLVAIGMVPVIKLTQCLKGAFQSNMEAKSLVADILTLLGQVQYNMSLRRRYMIRPNLKKKYFNLCNMNTPITSNLFGDDIAKEIRNCDTGVSIGKEPFSFPRGRGRPSGFRPTVRRGGYGGQDGYNGNRFQPYPARGSYGGYRGQGQNYRGNRGRRVAAATVTGPDQPKN